jgi:tungstate transport system substrate-binding protein
MYSSIDYIHVKQPSLVLMMLILSIASLLISSNLYAGQEQGSNILRLATTTSTQNSGLLDQLLPAFTQSTNIEVQVIAVGTGKALKMGRDGDVDVVMVHAKKAEDKFIEEKHGDYYKQFMFNDFVLVGPATDPAKISSVKSISQALTAIEKNQAMFISRGDDSGTHKKEISLWKNAGLSPSGSWHREIGQGMGKALQMASELQAYTLTDRGTWLAMQEKLELKLLYAGDKGLNNPYGIIAVTAIKFPDINYTGAVQLIDWICFDQAQSIIANYTIKGNQLFFPIPCK